MTTEVVRLRGAAQHNCRLCKSRRETNALDAGGTEDLYGQIEQFESADGLTDAQKAALRYVDALIWSPSQIGAEVAAGVHEHFSEDQALELTWDVMRNAANKIMVSLGCGCAAGGGGHGAVLRRARRTDGVAGSVVVEDDVVLDRIPLDV